MSISPCLSDSCSAANPNQRVLHDYEIKKITGLAREIIDKSPLPPKKCQHCGAVYIQELRAVGPDRVFQLGLLDSLIHGDGWHPFDRYK
jgi:hypothetical protein